ncbi:complement C1q tumor necrosis factor-related protein 2-like [Mercenaria mercenaria]|uniref:complement C1q tumor necrosis factor-related protein 2-like n=1 Tax=Mercenaria mercenaria TaxID=6596 RepID=UPI00234F7918|nr:complement C1q tumor necrosis factor-related protein 2-like [Mercenaria mercenaria]
MTSVQLFSFAFICFTCFSKVFSCEECKTEVGILKSKIKELENVINILNKTTLKRNELDLTPSEVRKRAIPDVNVAFSVSLTSDQNHIGLAQTIKFDNVLLNDGQGYNKHSGVFVAPQGGVYLFAYIFCHTNPSSSVSQTWIELMHNGKRINSGVGDSRHSWQDIQGTNIAIIRVNAGDSIWVQNFYEHDASLYTFEGATTFSGSLLYV